MSDGQSLQQAFALICIAAIVLGFLALIAQFTGNAIPLGGWGIILGATGLVLLWIFKRD